MEGNLIGNFIKSACSAIGIIGVFIALDLLLGAKVMVALKRILDKSIDIDKAIINSKAKISLGIVILILSLLILFLVTKVQL